MLNLSEFYCSKEIGLVMIITCYKNTCSEWMARCFVEDRVETVTVTRHFETCTVLPPKIKGVAGDEKQCK